MFETVYFRYHCYIAFTAKKRKNRVPVIAASDAAAGALLQRRPRRRIKIVCWTSLQSDQNLRGPQVAFQQQLSIDICCPRPTSAANPPADAAAVDRRDRHTDVRILNRFRAGFKGREQGTRPHAFHHTVPILFLASYGCLRDYNLVVAHC